VAVEGAFIHPSHRSNCRPSTATRRPSQATGNPTRRVGAASGAVVTRAFGEANSPPWRWREAGEVTPLGLMAWGGNYIRRCTAFLLLLLFNCGCGVL